MRRPQSVFSVCIGSLHLVITMSADIMAENKVLTSTETEISPFWRKFYLGNQTFF